MTVPKEDPDWLASWPRPSRATAQEVSSPDGRQWMVEAIRVGVPRLTNYHPFWLLIVFGGWMYHQLWHRGEWRLQVTDVDEGTIWELGTYSREEAEAQVALHVTELEAGRYRPHPREEGVEHERVVHEGAVATAMPLELGDRPRRWAAVVTVLLALAVVAPLVLLFALDDRSPLAVAGPRRRPRSRSSPCCAGERGAPSGDACAEISLRNPCVAADPVLESHRCNSHFPP